METVCEYFRKCLHVNCKHAKPHHELAECNSCTLYNPSGNTCVTLESRVFIDSIKAIDNNSIEFHLGHGYWVKDREVSNFTFDLVSDAFVRMNRKVDQRLYPVQPSTSKKRYSRVIDCLLEATMLLTREAKKDG